MEVFSVVLYGEGIDLFYEAVSFLGAARARGQKSLLFLRGPALGAFVRRRWASPGFDVSQDSFYFQNQSPDAFLEDLRGSEGVRVYACSAWVRLLKLSPQQVMERVDAVIGLNAFLAQSEGGPLLNF